MQLELGHVLTGLALRARKPQHQAFVEDVGTILQPRKSGPARFRYPPDQCFQSVTGRGPEIRTTAMAAGGRPDESAKMVSASS